MAEQGSVGFEFCVSCGEGTLLDYGMIQDMEAVCWLDIPQGASVIFSDAPDDCKTGE